MTAFNWTIENCEHEVATGGITVAHWRVNAVDGDYSASAYGSCGFTPDPSDPDFKPYNQVTQEDVLAWVWDQEDGWKTGIESSLSSQIDSAKNPVVTNGTPWA